MKAIFVTVALASLYGCGGGSSASTGPQPPSGNTTPPANGISVQNNTFTPGSKTIAPGAEVKWAWNSCTGDAYSGQTCVSHSVTFDDGVTSPTQDQGTYSRIFNAAGTYNYHCSIHGAAMAGTITVQ